MSIGAIRSSVLWSLMLLAPLCVPGVARAKVMAHVLTGDGNVLTFDTDSDTTTATKTLTNLRNFVGEKGHVVGSPTDNLLFVVDGRRSEFRVKVFELRSLTFKKDLGVSSTASPKILVPPQKPHFFIRWADLSGRAIVTRYDKATLTRQEDLSGITWLGDQISASLDGARLYSYEFETQDAINVIETQDLRLLSTVALEPTFTPGIWGSGIATIRDHVALLVENAKSLPTDSDRLMLFTLRLTDGAKSKKIVTDMQGEAYLTPATDKLLFEETADSVGPGGASLGLQSVGRLHLYDVATGAKLGQITIPLSGRNGLVKAIRPQGDKAYFFSGRLDGDRKLTSLSLMSFAALKDIPVQETVVLIVFFEQ